MNTHSAPTSSPASRLARRLSLALACSMALLQAQAQDIGSLLQTFQNATTAEAKDKAAMEIFKNYGEYRKTVVEKLGEATRDEGFFKTARQIDEQMVNMTKETWRDVAVRNGNGITHVVPVGTLGNRQTDPNYIPGKSDKDFIPMGPKAGEAAKDFQNAFERRYGVKPESLDINVLDPTDPSSWKGRVEAVANPEKYNTSGGNKWLTQELYNKDRNVWRVDPDSGGIAEKNIREVVSEPPKMTSSDAAGFFSDNTRFRAHYGELGDPAERILKQSKYDLRNVEAYGLVGGKASSSEQALIDAAKLAREGKMDAALEGYAKAMGMDAANKEAVMGAYLKNMDGFTEKMGGALVSHTMDDALRAGGASGAAKAELAGIISNLPKDMADKLGKQFAGDVAQAEVWKQSLQAATELKKAGFSVGEFNRQALSKYGKYYDELSEAERLALHGAGEEAAGFWSKAGKAAGLTAGAAAVIWSVYDAYKTGSQERGSAVGLASAGARGILDLAQMGYPPLAAAEMIGRLAALGIGYAVDAQKQDVLDKLYGQYKSGANIDDVLNDAEAMKYFPAGLRTFRQQIRDQAQREGKTLSDEQVDKAIRDYFVRRLDLEKQAGEVEKKLAWAQAWVNARGIPLIPGSDSDLDNSKLSPEDLQKALVQVVQNLLKIEDRLRADGIPYTKATLQYLLYLKYRGKDGDFEKEMSKLYGEYGKTYPPGSKKKRKVKKALETVAKDKPTSDAATSDTDKLATVKSANRATITRPSAPKKSGWVSQRQALWSGGGHFKKPKGEEPCDPEPSYGPFRVTTAGKLFGMIEGTPAVKGTWSLGNWNSGLHVYWQPLLGSKFGAGQEVLSLGGQVNDNKLSATVEWPGPGMISVRVSRPAGHGPLFGECFDQSWKARLEITDIKLEVPVGGGESVKPGDKLRTDGSGSVVGTTADGSRFKVGSNTEAGFERGADGSPRIVVNQSGWQGGVRVQHQPGKPGGTQVRTGGYTVRPNGTEYLCFNDRDTSRVAVIDGEVEIQSTTGTVARIKAGEQIELPGCTITPYDLAKDDAGAVEGTPLRELLLDNETPEPYGEYPLRLEPKGFSSGWVYQDPGNDATTQSLEGGAFCLTVPPGNGFWDRTISAPRLLHKVTGDFDLEGEIDLQTTATDNAVVQFIMRSPGSFEGYLAKQFNPDGDMAHYRLMGGSRARIQGQAKMPLLNREPLAKTADEPKGPVRMRMTRRGNLWKTYWSTDQGASWMLASREELEAPETLYVGWSFQREAVDRLGDVVALYTVRDAALRSAESQTLTNPDWDVSAKGGQATASCDSLDLTVGGEEFGYARADAGSPLSGDFDVAVRYSIDRWRRENTDSSAFSVFVTGGNDKNFAYIGQSHLAGEEPRLRTDMGIDGGWNRYRWNPRDMRQGYLRILRQGKILSTYFWDEGQWQQLDAPFNTGFDTPVYLGASVSNEEKEQTTCPVSARVEFANIVVGDTTATAAWVPPGASMLEPADVPETVELPEGVDAMSLIAPFTLGNIFCGAEANAYVFSGEREKKRLIEITPQGMANTYATTDVVAGLNRKCGAECEGRVVMTVDAWGAGGTNAGGIYELMRGGEYLRWTIEPDLGGISSLITGPQQTWYVCDFERDNVFSVGSGGGKLIELLTKGEHPGGIVSLAYDATARRLYALNANDGGVCTGKPGIYEIAEGEARLVAEMDQKNQGSAMVWVDKAGVLPRGLYVSEPTSGTICRVSRGGLQSVVRGLPEVSSMAVSPDGTALWVVFEKNKVLRLSGSKEGEAGAVEPPRAKSTPEPASASGSPGGERQPEATPAAEQVQATPAPETQGALPVHEPADPTQPVSAVPDAAPAPSPTPAPKGKLYRMAKKSDGYLLASSYPRTGLTAEFEVSYEKPGTILDTVGINAASAGAFSMSIASDGRVSFQIYDPSAQSTGKVPNGWHVLTSRAKLSPRTGHRITLLAENGSYTLWVDDQHEGRLVLATKLSGKPVYVGDYPGDSNWGPRYNIHQALIGSVNVLQFGAPEGQGEEAPAASADAPQASAPTPETTSAPAPDGPPDLEAYAGKWLVDGAKPDANTIELRISGNKIVGNIGGKNQIEFTSRQGEKLKGVVLGSRNKSKIPVTAELSRDAKRLILELAPPNSEFVTVTARRAKEEESSATPFEKALESAKPLAPGTSSGAVSTEDQAIERVTALPEVKKWTKQIDAARRKDPGRSARFEAFEEGKQFVVHVYEDVNDENGGHTATFGWFAVDKTTGKVTRNTP